MYAIEILFSNLCDCHEYFFTGIFCERKDAKSVQLYNFKNYLLSLLNFANGKIRGYTRGLIKESIRRISHSHNSKASITYMILL